MFHETGQRESHDAQTDLMKKFSFGCSLTSHPSVCMYFHRCDQKILEEFKIVVVAVYFEVTMS